MLYLFLTCKLLAIDGIGVDPNDPPVSFSFDSDVVTAQDGYIQLVWSGDADLELFEVQQASDPAFDEKKTIYRGPDRASFISGLSEGSYFFRVRSDGGSWSHTLEVQARHPSLRLAYLLMVIGSVVFLATSAVVIVGSRQKHVINHP